MAVALTAERSLLWQEAVRVPRQQINKGQANWLALLFLRLCFCSTVRK